MRAQTAINMIVAIVPLVMKTIIARSGNRDVATAPAKKTTLSHAVAGKTEIANDSDKTAEKTRSIINIDEIAFPCQIAKTRCKSKDNGKRRS